MTSISSISPSASGLIKSLKTSSKGFLAIFGCPDSIIFLNALSGRGVHVVTVNDYLAKRDAEWMGPIFEFHGLSVDCIDKHQPNSSARRKAYNSDITYGTNNEFGFDYLRDNMAISPDDLVQRGHNYTIVDEVDSVLVDDARTPLIISGPVPKGDDQLFLALKSRVVNLYSEQKKLFSEVFIKAKKLIAEEKTEEGGKLLLRAHKGLPKTKAIIKYLSEEGMKTLMHKTENFYMQENSKNMHVVTDPLFFVIDEKNNSIELTDQGLDLITGSSEDAEFFVLPDVGSDIAILEVGFGTGLNSFITFLEAPKFNLSVDYVGVEAYPIADEEFGKLNYVTALKAEKFSAVFNEMHRQDWGFKNKLSSRFYLNKRKQFFNDINDKHTFDLIYFDAFGARVQPELWTEVLFEKMYKALKSGGVLVTYSAKGSVRRAMQSVGFTVERLLGPPGKREMLRATKKKG